MRRGHPGIGGWRNENPRHFRPRGGGTPHFRPPRGYGHADAPRFQAPVPRPLLGPAPYPPNVAGNDHIPSEHHDRHGYRGGRTPRRPHDRGQYHHQGNRQIFPMLHRMRQGDVPDHNNFQDTPNYYDKNHQPWETMNSMGDIDHRNPGNMHSMGDIDHRNPGNMPMNRPSPWASNTCIFEDRSPTKSFRHQDSSEHNKIPQSDYTGHRPPASDHYGGNHGSTMDNSNTFSRSVDDTVDIIRKRLLNRDSQPPSESPSENQNDTDKPREPMSHRFSNVQQEQPTKKKSHKLKNIKSNCDKIKTKIVQQLFMMDKDRIHKLMDNPNSSSKFEYAINSLVTESQNSFNKHLRSVAEKSLGGPSSSEFIHDDNNTIYEDTFMKQMQGILDPQDTILLEDIKPIVLAELSKVLHLDDLRLRQEVEEPSYSRNDHPQYSQESYENYNDFEPYSPIDQQADYYEHKPDRSQSPDYENKDNEDYSNNQQNSFEAEPLFERRRSRKSSDRKHRKRSSEEKRRKDRRSIDSRCEEFLRRGTSRPLFDRSPENIESGTSRPLFDSNPENLRSGTSRPLFDTSPENVESGTTRPHFDSNPENLRRSDSSRPLFDSNPENVESVTPRPLFESKTENFRRSGTSQPLFDTSPENFESGTARPLFESNPENLRRSGTSRPLFDSNPENIESETSRPLFESKPESFKRSGTPRPLFDSNTEQLSDDEDPFAELDRQYHVAVDHNFIKNEYMSSPPNRPIRTQSPVVKREIPSQAPTPEKPVRNKVQVPLSIKPPEKPPAKVKEEIDSQLQNIAQSPLEFLSPKSMAGSETPAMKSESEIKQELISCNIPTPPKHRKSLEENAVSLPTSHEHAPEPQSANTTPIKSEILSHDKSSTPTDSRKRSTDLKPSHRKEKRKKSETSQPDTSNKQILNKNIIIHVSDCAAKTSDKSIFNLYFSKENSTKESSKDIKKVDSFDKKYSDKYVKRKEKESSSSKKSKDKDIDVKKKHDSSSSSHSTVNTSDVSNTSISQTSSKADNQTKLKPIDMFGDQLKKPGAHSANRNTSAHAPVELKPVIISRKITKRHIATQVVRKCTSRETQTAESKSSSSKFCQTERKKLITRGAQTEPVSFKAGSRSKDPLERMKEIDMEIQALLQEKFKLYNSLENKESGTNTMQSLGMAVLNVAPADPNENESSISEDMIVDEFTNIPVEELEQIALESVQEEQNQLSAQAERKSRRKKLQQERKRRDSSLSTTTSTASSRRKRAAKTPNISLIEQIITDDRPLEDIISLDDFEIPISKKRSHKAQSKPKKNSSKKKVTKPVHNIVNHDIKACSVLLRRDDLNKLLRKFKKALNAKVHSEPVTKSTDKAPTEEKADPETFVSEAADKPATPQPPPKSEAGETSSAQTLEIVEQVINDIQFDMLDVSEDIVIGEEVSLKSEEKDAGDISTPAISEEIILDNSQSSMDEAAAESSNECKMYDYSSDENLRRDSVTVSGNGDAVLAIECIDNNFIAACLDGNVYYFSGEGKLLNTLRGSNLAVTCLTIVKEKYGTTVYTGSLDSRIRYYDLDTGMEKGPECNVLSPIQTMDRAWDTVFVGTRTGFVLQFECKNNMLIPVSTVKFSDQSILALRAMKEGPRKVLLVAARSEPVTIKDAQTGLLLRSLEGPKMTVYTLLFEDGKVYCGTSSHQIHVFDYASGSHMGSHEGGKGAVCLRSAGGLLFAGCYDGCVYIYREGEAAPLAQLRGPSLMLLSLTVQGTKIIAGYKDRSLYIWKMPLAIVQEMIL